MSNFVPLLLPNLNFNQEIVTSTISTNIGLNNIINIQQQNNQAIRTLTDKSISGGGLSDDNVRQMGLTNISTNLFIDSIEQVGNSSLSVLTNGFGNFSANLVMANGTIANVLANKKLMFVFSSTLKVTQAPTNPDVDSQLFIQVSNLVSFSSILYSREISQELFKSTVNNQPNWATRSLCGTGKYINLTNQTLYYRLMCRMSGNSISTADFYNGICTVFMS
jgi:hypothetical protein